ncbi:MAG TPA: protein kinase [Kofleriaceae bacterium]|nr:protein kinase [Kofleriaceae bacterium]
MARVERLGKYELLRHLASGGMARVYLARVEGVGGFQRHLVLKTVRPERTDDTSYVSMFLDEARLIATLHHQHIAQVYDIGVADDGTYFLAMEYLHGETMRHVLERARDLRQRLPLDFSLTVVAAAAAGLHHAHERRGPDGRPLGIVHRDVTPSNVIAGYDGSLKLIDFGIAKAAERSTTTKTGFIKGKAGYMAPEQALGHPVDRRADVFSLGVMLYELTTQTRAFPAASELEVAHRIVRGDVTPPSVAVSGYPQELEDVVMAALARDPDDRFGDADALAYAVNHAASHLGVALGPAAVVRVLGQMFGSKPEPWLMEEAEEEIEFSKTGDTASLLDSRPLLATSAEEALAFARGTGAQDPVPRTRPRTESGAVRSGPVASPMHVVHVTAPPAPQLEIIDDDDGDEMPTVKFVALDEAEIIIEHHPPSRTGESGPRSGVRVLPGQSVAAAAQSVSRVLAPLPGLTEPPPPGRVITTSAAPAPIVHSPSGPHAAPPAIIHSPSGPHAAPPAIVHSPAPPGAHPPIPRPAPSKLNPPLRPAIGSQPPPFERTPAPSTRQSGPMAAIPAPQTHAQGSSSAPVPMHAQGSSSTPVVMPPGAVPVVVPTRQSGPIGSIGAIAPIDIAPPANVPMASPMPGTPLPRPITSRPVTSRPVTSPLSPIGMRTDEVMAFSTIEARTKRNRLLLPLLAGAALAAIVIIVLASVLGGDDETVTPAQPLAADQAPATNAPTTAAPPVAPAKPVETTTIKVRITSVPDDATVMLDGERLGRTPLEIERPRKSGTVVLKVRRKGYSTKKLDVDTGANIIQSFELHKSK